MLKNSLLAIFSFLLIFSCRHENTHLHNTSPSELKDTVKLNDIEEIKLDSTTVEQAEKINVTDSHGLKQGKWIKKWKGKIIEIANFKNDLLDGYYVSKEMGGGFEGHYENGKKEGMFYYWYEFKKKHFQYAILKETV